MKKILLICVTLFFALSAFSSNQKNCSQDVDPVVHAQDLILQQGKEPISTDDMLKTMTNREKCWMELIPEQYLEDFDVLFEELQNNYPYFGVALLS